MALKAYEPKNKEVYDNFDAVMRFQPRDVFGRKDTKTVFQKKLETYLRALPERYQIWFSGLALKFQTGKVHDYDRFWKQLIRTAEQDLSSDKPIYQSIPVDWDNTPRYRKKSQYFFNYAPEKFKANLTRLLKVFFRADQQEVFLFVNAWNEWSEGAYLEPDEKHRFKSLETLQALQTYAGP
jgi:hypothetical protein